MNPVGALLKEFELYLASRADQHVAAFLDGFDWGLQPRQLDARALPVVQFLSGDFSPAGPEQALAANISATARDLFWQQSYAAADLGQHFLDRYGWVELFGTRGHFECADMAGGILMLGPGVFYPAHHHIAEEIYIPLTSGTFWSKAGSSIEGREAGEIIFHPSGISHAMKTEQTPLIAFYLWRGGPLAQKPVMGDGDKNA